MGSINFMFNLKFTVMYFEINIAKFEKSNGFGDDGYRHYFATSERSLTSSDKAAELVDDLKARFPEPEFKISITCNPQRYHGLDLDGKIEDTKKLIGDLANNALK